MRVAIAWTERGSARWRRSRWPAEAMLQQAMARTIRVSIAWTELYERPNVGMRTMVTYRSATHTLPQCERCSGRDMESGCWGSAERAPNVGMTGMAAWQFPARPHFQSLSLWESGE